MPPQSRGPSFKAPPVRRDYQAQSSPIIPTLRSFQSSTSNNASTNAFYSDETDSDEEDDKAERAPHRPLSSYSSRSNMYLSPSMLAPPFYGRPPTPLPPSPSLTSLLRPNFSSQNSRPTTPDPSSDEGTSNNRGDVTGTQTPNSAAASTLTNSFRTAKPIPRASPKVPTYEYYGFTLYLTSSLVFVLYLLWSFLPAPLLHQLGIHYYPSRWWALAIPAWTVMLILYIYVALASYNTGYLTLPMGSVECLVDEAANIAVLDANGRPIGQPQTSSWQESPMDTTRNRKKSKSKGGQPVPNGLSMNPRSTHERILDWRSLWNEGTDAVMDIPIGGVCEILYGEHHNAGETGMK